MDRLREKFNQLREKNKKALTCFITVGYPSIKATEKLLHLFESSGVDIVELGVPFSDPIADGTTIQHSSECALKKKISLSKTLQFVKKIRDKTDIPLVIMTYLNPVFKYGMKKFFKDAKYAGIDGVIFPDLIPEESKILENYNKKYQMPVIYLFTPTTSIKRQDIIFQRSQGFVYIVSLTGVTGARKQLPEDLTLFLKRIRQETNKPILLGFGISTPKQIRKILSYIDGIIIGSAIINKIKTAKTMKTVKSFIESFRKTLIIEGSRIKCRARL